jgi:undecaprenol kinase/diacylglycerol kinase (ATP)
MKQQKFSIKKRLKSFHYAFNGLKILIKEEHNARIHLTVTIIVIVACFLLSLSSWEWIAVIFCIGLVIASEIINSAIENLSDFVCKEKNYNIKKIKDLSAAAVLISAIAAFVIGLIIFLPKIITLCSKF